MIKRLAHVCFFSDNADAMVAFYRDKLGFPLAFTMKGDDGSPFGWYLECGSDSFIEIFDQLGAVRQWGGEVAALRGAEDGRYRHFCFEVAGLKAFRKKLLAQEVQVGGITMGLDFSYQCWIKDPDGNDIELMEYTSESLQFSRGRDS